MSLLKLSDIWIDCILCGKNLPLAQMQQHIFDEHSDHAE